MPGFAGGGGPAAADILPRLYEDLLRAVGLTAMFRADARPDGVVYYLASASGASQPSPEDLAQLLAACPDDGAALAGLTELRGLLRAMRISQSGAVRLGSLIVRQTADGRCQGAVLTPAEAVALDAAGAAGAEAQWAGQLDRIEGDRLVDLTAWVSRG
jgi:hypothetical protein